MQHKYRINDFKNQIILWIILIIIISTIFSFYISNSNLNNELESTIITSNLAFIGTILAIVFTLIVLPVQKILGKYTPELLNHVFDKNFFIPLYSFMSLFLLNSLILIFFPAYKSTSWGALLLLISFSSGILSFVILLFVIKRVFYMLDPRNQIDEIYEKTMISLNENLDIKKNIENIIDVIKRSILDDRFEVAEHGLKIVGTLTLDYLDKNNFESGDEYIVLISSFLKNAPGIISKNSNMIILSSVIAVTTKICVRILDERNENLSPIAQEFVKLLENIFSNNELVDSSSIKTDVLDNLGAIARKSLDVQNKNIYDFTISIIGRN